MELINIGRQGKFYTLNGVVVKPDAFYGIDGFKFVNHIWAWVQGGAMGEGGGVHLARAERYIVEEVLGNGCLRMRSPIELMFWSGPYFDLDPSNPAPYNKVNVANKMSLIDLNVATGSGFELTPGAKKVIRMLVVLARRYGIVIEVPWLWTIKGPANDESLARLGLARDPRDRFDRPDLNLGGVSIWNEHYLAAQGIGAYLHRLRTEGDGDGDSRVDPGPLNLLHDIMNEWTVHSDRWNQTQLRNVARRWHERDAVGELCMISESGEADEYGPPLVSQAGAQGYEGPMLHPPRSGEWARTGTVARNHWPNELIDMNESQLGLTQAQRDFWVPLIPKWAGLGSTDMATWRRMHENFVSEDCYTTFHTFRGMDAGWPESEQTVVEETIRAITGGGSGPPPPPPIQKTYRYERLIQKAWNDILGHDLKDEGVLADRNDQMKLWYEGADGIPPRTRGLSDAAHRDVLIGSGEYRDKNPDNN